MLYLHCDLHFYLLCNFTCTASYSSLALLLALSRIAFGVAVSVFVVDPPALPTTQDNDHHQPCPPDRPHPVARRPDCTNKSFLSFSLRSKARNSLLSNPTLPQPCRRVCRTWPSDPTSFAKPCGPILEACRARVVFKHCPRRSPLNRLWVFSTCGSRPFWSGVTAPKASAEAIAAL